MNKNEEIKIIEMTKNQARKDLHNSDIKRIFLKKRYEIRFENGMYELRNWYSMGEGIGLTTHFNYPIVESKDFTDCWNKAKELDLI